MFNTISRRFLFCASAAAITLAAMPANAMQDVAPDFSAINSKGEAVSLSQFAGKKVVLEWTNHDCPYVRRHYGTGNMQALQANAAANDVVWLSVISSAPGRQGHVSGAEADMLSQARNATPAHVLMDPNGQLGRLYGARTTPHMFVVDEAGKLAYTGAIDDSPWGNPSTNYVTAALDSLAQDQAPQIRNTRAYGCSVKY